MGCVVWRVPRLPFSSLPPYDPGAGSGGIRWARVTSPGSVPCRAGIAVSRPLSTMRILSSSVGLSCLFLLGACGGGGGGGGSSLKLKVIDGTWRIESTVTTSTGCAIVGSREVTYVNLANTSGTVVEVTDAEAPVPALLLAEAAGRSVVWTGNGTDAGDSFTFTLDAGNAAFAGSAVEFDETPNCTTNYSVVGTKVVGATAVAAGNWTFQVTGNVGNFEFADLDLQQRFSSIQAGDAATHLAGVVQGAGWDGALQTTNAGGLDLTFTGVFTDSKTFEGTCQRTVGSTTVDGSITGEWVSGGVACTGVDTSRLWNISINSGVLFTGTPTVFERCTAQKVGCTVTFTWDSRLQYPSMFPVKTVVFTGTIIDNNVYRPTVSGTWFAESYPGTTFTFDGIFVGSLSTRWTGTYGASGATSGSGSILFQRR